jgi:hypothetical protein
MPLFKAVSIRYDVHIDPRTDYRTDVFGKSGFLRKGKGLNNLSVHRQHVIKPTTKLPHKALFLWYVLNLCS